MFSFPDQSPTGQWIRNEYLTSRFNAYRSAFTNDVHVRVEPPPASGCSVGVSHKRGV
jgi:hypothetical protein